VLPVFPGQSVLLGSVSRGHGPDGRYRDHYSGVTLQRWADFVAEVPIEIGEGRRCGPLLPLAPAGAAAV